MGEVEMAAQARMEATTVFNNVIPMLNLMDKATTTQLPGTKAIQVFGIKQHAEAPRSLMASTIMDPTAPTFQPCTDLLLGTCSLRMHIHHRLRQVVRSLPVRDHIQQLSRNLPQLDQDHMLLQPFRASMLAYHSLCHRRLQTIQRLRPRNLENTTSSA
jgi:hypothetical protein